MTWDGKTERRKEDSGMRDLLIRIDEKVSNLIDNYSKHEEEDKIRFGRIETKQESHSKFIWIAVGGISVLQVVLHFLK